MVCEITNRNGIVTEGDSPVLCVAVYGAYVSCLADTASIPENDSPVLCVAVYGAVRTYVECPCIATSVASVVAFSHAALTVVLDGLATLFLISFRQWASCFCFVWVGSVRYCLCAV